MRLGYMVAPWEIMSRLISSKNDAGSGVMDQMIVGDFFTNHYDEHIHDLRGALERKRDALSSALLESFGPNVEFEIPRGGMYLWLKFPEGVDTRNWSPRHSKKASHSIRDRTGPPIQRQPPTTSGSASRSPQ